VFQFFSEIFVTTKNPCRQESKEKNYAKVLGKLERLCPSLRFKNFIPLNQEKKKLQNNENAAGS
jgi:hypothetical protein